MFWFVFRGGQIGPDAHASATRTRASKEGFLFRVF